MSDDIVDRLVALGDKLRYDWAGLNDPPVTVAEEAADEIVRLRKWKSEASIVIDRWEAAWESAGSPGQLGDAKSDALRDEIVRLRAEVDAIASLHTPRCCDPTWCHPCDDEWPCATYLLIHPKEYK